MLERKWEQTTHELPPTDHVLEVWDGGYRKYERWPDGTECSWELVSWDIKTGLQVLRELPSWDTPAVTMWYEKIPVYISKNNEFQIPGWSVTSRFITEPIKSENKQVSTIPIQGPNTIYTRQPDSLAKQNINRRHCHKKKPHMGSGPRHRFDEA